jgi:hypothetical protein
MGGAVIALALTLASAGAAQARPHRPADQVRPLATLAPLRAVYNIDDLATVDFSCVDEHLATCVATLDGLPVADGARVPVGAEGPHDVLVTGTDRAGNVGTTAARYVVDGTAPTVTITAPADGATYVVGQVVVADYACADPNLAFCAAPWDGVEKGQALDTTTPTPPGEWLEYRVRAADAASNSVIVTHTYRVVPAPPDPRPETSSTVPARTATAPASEGRDDPAASGRELAAVTPPPAAPVAGASHTAATAAPLPSLTLGAPARDAAGRVHVPLTCPSAVTPCSVHVRVAFSGAGHRLAPLTRRATIRAGRTVTLVLAGTGAQRRALARLRRPGVVVSVRSGGAGTLVRTSTLR